MGMLRERMAEDLRLHRFVPVTVTSYLRHAQRFADFYPGRSPVKLGAEEVRAHLVHLVDEEHISASTHVVCLASLKFLYGVTLKRPEVVASIRYPKRAALLPMVLSGSEVQGLVSTLLYAARVRVSGGCRLGLKDIDSRRGFRGVFGRCHRHKQPPPGQGERRKR